MGQKIKQESTQRTEKAADEMTVMDSTSDQQSFGRLASYKTNDVEAVCERVQSIDSTIKKSLINLSEEDDRLYREAYLDILKSKIPTTNHNGKKEYFKDLYKAGMTFEELEMWIDYFSFYYHDLDGDGLPELGVRSNGYTYILKYEPRINEFLVIFDGPTMYIRILGAGQIWYHDGLHSDVVRDNYIVLNSDSEWETIFELEQGIAETDTYYNISIDEYKKIDVGEKNWNIVTRPFFDATRNALPSLKFDEIFDPMQEETE